MKAQHSEHRFWRRVAVAAGILVLAVAVVVALLHWHASGRGGTGMADGNGPDGTSPAGRFSFSRGTLAKLAGAGAKTPNSPALPAGSNPGTRPSGDAFARLWQRAVEERDGAAVYRMVFELMAADSAAGKVGRIKELLGTTDWARRYAGLGQAEKDELLELLASPEIGAILELMGEAASKGNCDFQIDFSQGLSLDLGYLDPMRRLVQLAGLAMLAAGERGDPEAALGIAETGMRISQDAGGGGLMLTCLVEMACDQELLACLDTIARHPDLPVDHAYALLVQMAGRDYAGEVKAAIQRESAIFLDHADRVADNPELAAELISREDLLPRLHDKDFIARNKTVLAASFDRYAELADWSDGSGRQEAAALLDNEILSLPEEEAFLAQALLPPYGSLIRRAGTLVSEVDLAYVDLVVEIFRRENGREPQSIEDLESIIRRAAP